MKRSPPELVYPLTGLLITFICLSAVSNVVKHEQYNPSNRTFKLM